MSHMLSIHTGDPLDLSLCDQIAHIDGVETVYGFDTHTSKNGDGNYMVVLSHNLSEARRAIEVLCPCCYIYMRLIVRQQAFTQPANITEVPWVTSKPARLKVASLPIITSADIPGPLPTMRAPSRVHQNLSSQAGLASFGGPCDTETAGLVNLAGTMGFGSCLGNLSEMLS
ncbi:hypothetical protein H0W80_02860 [Candidatus Saccharibacteria bacterium]|nr:hypothetical protein [Candidatus Saccharibacteria bacterium]